MGQRHNAFGDVDGSNLQTFGAYLDTNHEAVNPSRSWFEDSVSWGLAGAENNSEYQPIRLATRSAISKVSSSEAMAVKSRMQPI